MGVITGARTLEPLEDWELGTWSGDHFDLDTGHVYFSTAFSDYRQERHTMQTVRPKGNIYYLSADSNVGSFGIMTFFRADESAEANMNEAEDRKESRKEAEFLLRDDLVIVQANFKQAPKRARALLESEFNRKNGRPADIIVGCDPGLKTAWSSKFCYRLDMCPERPLLETDNPDELSRAKKTAKSGKTKGQSGKTTEQENDPKPVQLARVFFFVHKSIPKNRWHVEYHDDANKNLAATLYLTTSLGEIAIHSVYNVNQPGAKIDVNRLIQRTTASRLDIVMGDFNLHHWAWSGKLLKKHKTSDSAENLHNGMAVAGMKQLTVPGTVTWAPGKGDGGKSPSCIDLTFVSGELYPAFKSWGLDKFNPWDDSDHRPIRTVFDIRPCRDESKVYLWRKTPKGAFEAAVAKGLAGMDISEPTTPKEADELAEEIMSVIWNAIVECVPTRLANPPPESRRPNRHKQSMLQNQGLSTAQPATHQGRQGTKTKQWYNQEIEKTGKNDRFRRHIQAQGQRRNGAWIVAKIAKAMAQSRIESRMPTLCQDTDGVTYATEEGKHKCLRDSMWSETSDEAPPAPRMPDMAIDRIEHDIKQFLDEKEVEMACAVLVPALTLLFRGCLKISHHPSVFKHAITAVLAKPDKKSYHSPKSWRPIALLSIPGKILEKLVADRLKKIAQEHSLLPRTQYGAPGKSTTHAVQDLLHPVYQGWQVCFNRKGTRWRRLQKKATMMGLDISGAFDNINRDKLLQILADKGLPGWMIRFVHSFLSHRSTVLKLPGSISELFYVNIGIPQGSPLSPILFLFFAAPLLESISTGLVKGVRIEAFAYVDDTYLVAVSSSYRKNCERLKDVHDQILAWANPMKVSFSPHKYNIMHFKCPKDKGSDCKLLPEIDGLVGNPECLVPELKVLGVIVDHRLTWEPQIIAIEKKVNKQLNHVKKIMGNVWGLSLDAARLIFISKIRNTIAYACAVWFVHSQSQELSQPLHSKLIERLEKLYYECLVTVSGALNRTSQRMLEKELNIESLRIFLYRTAMAFRAKTLEVSVCDPYIKEPCHPTDPRERMPTDYELLDEEAFRLCDDARKHLFAREGNDESKFLVKWMDPDRRKAAINQQAKREAAEKSAELWDNYRRDRAARHPGPHYPRAIEENWGPQSLRYYDGLTRGQSTILLHCRTEFIGLNYYLNRINASRPGSGRQQLGSPESATLEGVPAACSCGYSKQTVFHMFTQCPELRAARRQLQEKIGHLKFDKLLTGNTAVVSDWALTYLKLDQFVFPRLDSRFRDIKVGA
ncbi:hypothetical protein FSARC_11969 [Fusarium sarcochroum]|uniref:Reverse transcriptase domain-containing protein n=1 Tax=Fusarium sarcochroum TaxID=1208366 RepID=A0A8H4TBL4_9HYPO|nr:hypothetical protein FSARC_11969 [Fusarium sarcochroum]